SRSVSAQRAADDSASAARNPRLACAGGASAAIMRPVTYSSTATSSASLLPNSECSVPRLTPASPASLRVVMAAPPSRAIAREAATLIGLRRSLIRPIIVFPRGVRRPLPCAPPPLLLHFPLWACARTLSCGSLLVFASGHFILSSIDRLAGL